MPAWCAAESGGEVDVANESGIPAVAIPAIVP